MMVLVRRAVLYSFWATEPRTLSSNLGALRRMHQDGQSGLGLMRPLPCLGPFPLEDLVGIIPALLALQASLRPSCYAPHLQWDSMRANPMAWGNMWNAGVSGLSGAVLTKEE